MTDVNSNVMPQFVVDLRQQTWFANKESKTTSHCLHYAMFL